MKLYHGSYSYVNPVELRKTTARLDFGPGFYVSDDLEQAEEWAKIKASNKKSFPAVTVLDFFPNQNLNIKVFKGKSKAWADFIWKQKFVQKGHNYDLVKGPCITGQALEYAKTMSQFQESCDLGKLLDKALKETKTLWQLAFCSQAAIDCLTVKPHESFVKTPEQTKYYFSSQYTKEDIFCINSILTRTVQFLVGHLVKDFCMTEDSALNRIYSSQTYADLNNIQLEFWGESDSFIYEILKQELLGE